MISIPSNITALTPYKPGQTPEETARLYGISDVVKLASNENPLGASPLALQAVNSLSGSAYSLYPDGGLALRESLAEQFGTNVENVICHSGSDALIHLAHRTFVTPSDTLVSARGTFIGFQVAASLSGAEIIYTSLTGDYRFDAEALVNAVTPKTKVLYIANINNPTGTYLTADELTYILDRTPETTLVILDEAYFEYSLYIADDYPDGMALRRPNTLILRTFSKCYGLAGLRVGYGIGDSGVIAAMLKAKLPFEPNTAGQAAAKAALRDKEFLQKTVELNARGLKLFRRTIEEANLYAPVSAGNFVMLDCGNSETAERVFHSLLRKGFITRPLAGGFALPNCIRVNTGTDEQNERFCSALRETAAEIPELARVRQ
ncbi:histidinol-phosphate transaminase [Ignavibacteria bacterium]|nr:aminotransferase class I/II-fold pyridoxal phosphate-dependent enzyme [Bacteroidota bacterium]MCZ2132283.1 aminotransferase class I/II-fold pyridoxal phosphate-dependent enzyme [Bacteroidota bacterium]